MSVISLAFTLKSVSQLGHMLFGADRCKPPGIVPDIRTPHQEGELCARHLVATDTWEPLETPPLENWTKQAASAAPSSPTAPFASATKQRQPPSAHCGLCGCATARTANPLIFVMQEPYQTTGRWGGSSRPTNQVPSRVAVHLSDPVPSAAYQLPTPRAGFAGTARKHRRQSFTHRRLCLQGDISNTAAAPA
ncbi:uncharacterized protein LOC144115640 isoform X4 [Amblyomma americanum]